MDDRRDKVEKSRVDKSRGGLRLRILHHYRWRKFRKGGIEIFVYVSSITRQRQFTRSKSREIERKFCTNVFIVVLRTLAFKSIIDFNLNC